jgi:hypothetical protein
MSHECVVWTGTSTHDRVPSGFLQLGMRAAAQSIPGQDPTEGEGTWIGKRISQDSLR